LRCTACSPQSSYGVPAFAAERTFRNIALTVLAVSSTYVLFA
jgi:hypothetical protein